MFFSKGTTPQQQTKKPPRKTSTGFDEDDQDDDYKDDEAVDLASLASRVESLERRTLLLEAGLVKRKRPDAPVVDAATLAGTAVPAGLASWLPNHLSALRQGLFMFAFYQPVGRTNAEALSVAVREVLSNYLLPMLTQQEQRVYYTSGAFDAIKVQALASQVIEWNRQQSGYKKRLTDYLADGRIGRVDKLVHFGAMDLAHSKFMSERLSADAAHDSEQDRRMRELLIKDGGRHMDMNRFSDGGYNAFYNFVTTTYPQFKEGRDLKTWKRDVGFEPANPAPQQVTFLGKKDKMLLHESFSATLLNLESQWPKEE